MDFPVAMTLKQARELKGYNQEEAAKLIGISKDTLGNYERGKSYPDVPIIRRIEELYGVPYKSTYFFTFRFDKTVNSI